MSKIPRHDPNRLRNNTIVSGLMVFAFILTACGGGGNGGGPTPRPTWPGCNDITPRAPFAVSAAEATEAMGNLNNGSEDASCVATKRPIYVATGTAVPR